MRRKRGCYDVRIAVQTKPSGGGECESNRKLQKYCLWSPILKRIANVDSGYEHKRYSG